MRVDLMQSAEDSKRTKDWVSSKRELPSSECMTWTLIFPASGCELDGNMSSSWVWHLLNFTLEIKPLGVLGHQFID